MISRFSAIHLVKRKQYTKKVGRQVVGASDVDFFIGTVRAEVEEGWFF
jgi:hypothetical protein